MAIPAFNSGQPEKKQVSTTGYPHWDKWDTKPKVIPATSTGTTTVTFSDPFTQLHNMLDPWTFGFERHLELFKNLEDVRIKSNYPPYNIRTLDEEDKAIIELAIAGFRRSDVKITYKENIITVEGNRGEDTGEYSYKGIAARNFVQKFAVADDVVVRGAKLEDGLLSIGLERILPENKKAKTIDIE